MRFNGMGWLLAETAVFFVLTPSEAYDRCQRATARVDPKATRAGQHIMAPAIVPAHQTGSDGSLAQQHRHWIVNVRRCDIAIRIDFLQRLNQLFF